MKAKDFYKFVAPSLIAMGTLLVFPLVMATWLGLNFMTYRNINNPVFVGLANYIEVLTDQRFWQAFRFTVLFIAITVPATIVIGFLLALFLDQISGHVRGVFITTYLLPMVIVPVVGTMMFRLLFVPSGIAAWLYQEILKQPFFFNEVSVKILIILNAIWTTTPFPFIVMYAGLQTLPQEQIEAALMDGANRRQQVRYIVIPHLSSLLVFLGLILIMDAYRVFDSIFVLTQQNPIYKAASVMSYIFRTAMAVQQLGLANAMAILTVIMVMIVLIPLLVHTYHDQIEER